MEYNVGNKIKYTFPISTKTKEQVFIGIVESVASSFVVVRDINNIILKVTFKNFNNIEVISRLDQCSDST
ncbi:MAG: hypothetical protein FD143_269 [Ignavibacteria bacterium]|nr:MAG: hypothetical protein FD143_269 [Ignavibacteria bacterium]KAF0160889.1 MAG: hypothetical protein FD188_1295 [Ignavibacteria bacterium]